MKLKPATLLLLLFASVFLLPVTAGQDSASAAAKHPTCTACLGQQLAPCAGCTMDSDLAWTTTGERLAAAGLGPAALAHFDVAISRAEARNEERIRAYVGTAKERAAYTKELGKVVKAVKKRRATLAKKLGL